MATKTQDNRDNQSRLEFQTVRGMRDILPEDQPYWEKLFDAFKQEVEYWGYEKIETPILEDTQLFRRGVGQETDIVHKEMFSFKTQGGAEVTMRPEGTAPVVRAYLEHGFKSRQNPVKLYYIGPFFRYERPQRGRYRQFYQLGFEVLGSGSPAIEAEGVKIVANFLESIGLTDYVFQVASIGDENCRPAYLEKLTEFLKAHRATLPQTEWERIIRRPLHLFDSNSEKAQRLAKAAPKILDNLDKECHRHFKEFLEVLDELEVNYNLNPNIVRGLDYYTRTVFEVWLRFDKEGRVALGGGGRYDRLAEVLGGEATPAAGVALGADRLVEVLKERQIPGPAKAAPQIFLAQLSSEAKRHAFELFDRLKKGGIQAAASFDRDSLRSQLKIADKLGVKYALILGQKEFMDGNILLRDMQTGSQEILPISRLVTEIKKRLNLK